ncbi:SRPBCC family protein [Actinophytocola glycyrrhizae]|uniref:SRPBCC family protein n=1 Tax=Actinophytocola glycyrrhizae TaxID=2044873 RepID=A0ABV9S7R8_9PSEU
MGTRLRGRAMRVARRIGHGRRALGHDLASRGHGVLATARYLVAGRRVEDDVLHERLRSELGRHVRHPHAVRVDVDGGHVTLTGDVLAGEAGRTRRALRRVPGVHGVTAAWTTHADTAGVSALQGAGRVPRSRHWSPSTRLLAGTAAAGTLLAARRAPAPLAWALRGTGAAVGARAVANLPLRRVTGVGAGREAVTHQAAVCVTATPEQVWAVVGDYGNFAAIMPDVLRVDRSEDGRLSHWEIRGPGGLPVGFDAEETAREEGRWLSWQTRDGQRLAHAGTLRLDPVGVGRTRVQVRLTCNPVTGVVGNAVAALLGASPARRLQDGLAHLKTAVETDAVTAP